MSSFPVPATPSAQGAFALLARAVLGAPAAAITFSGLDTSNRMFRLTGYIIDETPTANNIFVRLNNDSGASYDAQTFEYNNVTLSVGRSPGANVLFVTPGQNLAAGESCTFEMMIAKQQSGDEAMVFHQAIVDSTVGVVNPQSGQVWNNTAALISRIDVISSAGNFDTDSVAILEGNST